MKKNYKELFKGLKAKKLDKQYVLLQRYNKDFSKIVVKVGDSHLIENNASYTLILDQTHAILIDKEQVNCNEFGNEVLINFEDWNVKIYGPFDDFGPNEEITKFDFWVKAAKTQSDAGNLAVWKI